MTNLRQKAGFIIFAPASIVQFVVAVFFVFQTIFLKKVEVAEQAEYSKHQPYCGEITAVYSIYNTHEVDSSRFTRQVLEALLTDERLVQRISSSILTEFNPSSFTQEKKVTEQIILDINKGDVGSWSTEELSLKIDDFIANEQVSLVSIDVFFRGLGQLNKAQRQVERRKVAMSVKTGQIDFYQ